MDDSQPLIGSDRVSYGTEAITINRPKWRVNLSLAFVLLTETLERLAFYGLLCNLALSLNSDPFLWNSYNASHAVMIFTGMSYFMAVLGGWLADSLLGKFWTVSTFFLFYIAGSSLWPSFYGPSEKHLNCTNHSSIQMWCEPEGQSNRTGYVPLYKETCSSAVFLALALIAIGYGCVRVNIVPFGAQQVESQEGRSLRIYFNWLYWCINVGACIAYGLLGFVQQEVSYFSGYIGPVCALVLAWGTFVSGSWCYRKKFYLDGSPLKDIVLVIVSSVRISFVRAWHRISRRRTYSDNVSCLERTSVSHGGEFLEEHVRSTKAFLKILLVFLCLVPYWITYYQIQSTFLIQGMHMKLDVGNMTSKHRKDSSFKVSLSWLSLFNIIFVIIIVPLLDRIVYPLLDSFRLSPSMRFRVLLGMFFSMAAMAVAGYVENVRLRTYWGDDNEGHPYIQYIACTEYFAADMSIFWQVPQYLLIAMSEVFTSIAGLEMAYVCAPRSIQSIIIGFYYWSQGIGSLFNSLIILSLEPVWFYYYDFGNINCERSPFLPDAHLHPESSCHLDYYFYLLAGVQAFGIIAFGFAAYFLDVGGNGSKRDASTRRREASHRDD